MKKPKGFRWLQILVATILLTPIFASGCALFYESPPPIHFTTKRRDDGSVIDLVAVSRGDIDRCHDGTIILSIPTGHTDAYFNVGSPDGESEFIVPFGASTGLKGAIVGVPPIAADLRGAVWLASLRPIWRNDSDRYYDLSISGRPASHRSFLVGATSFSRSTEIVIELPPETIKQIGPEDWMAYCRGEAGASLVLWSAYRTLGQDFQFQGSQHSLLRVQQGSVARTLEFHDRGWHQLRLQPGRAKIFWFAAGERSVAIEVSLEVGAEMSSTWMSFSSIRDLTSPRE